MAGTFSSWRAVALLAVALALAACGGKPADPAAAAQAFFDQLIAGKTEEAYRSTAFAFQAQQSAKAFDATARETGLVGATLSSLTADGVDGDLAKLRAELKTAQGQDRTLLLSLHLEAGAWRLISLHPPRDPKTGRIDDRFSILGKPMAFNEAINKSMPSERDTRRMVQEATGTFAEAVKKGSFEDFYNYVSRAWQAQLTERQLQRAFQEFIDKNVQLEGLTRLEPIFDEPPHVTSEGLLLVSGHYPSKPYEVAFGYKFVYELPEWKLFGVDLFLRQPPGTPATTPAPAASP